MADPRCAERAIMRGMQEQATRDEKTLGIATALAVFVATFAITTLGIAVFGDLSHDFDPAFRWVTIIASAAGIGSLVLRRS